MIFRYIWVYTDNSLQIFVKHAKKTIACSSKPLQK